MGAVKTRGDAEMAHLMVVLWGKGGGGELAQFWRRHVWQACPHAELSFELVVSHVLRPVISFGTLAPAA
jgi:hypothetical protein